MEFFIGEMIRRARTKRCRYTLGCDENPIAR